MSTSEPDVMCRFCGAWGPPRGFHSCPQMSPNQPQQQQVWEQDPVPELRRIADALERIADALGKEQP